MWTKRPTVVEDGGVKAEAVYPAARMVRTLRLDQRTRSRMIRGSSVHYEQLTNWSPAGIGRRDQRTRKRLFSGDVAAAKGLASTPKKPPPKSDQRLAVVD